jgi:M6 family metalloprotease-like protein
MFQVFSYLILKTYMHKMYKRFALLLALVCLSIHIFAVPAKPITKRIMVGNLEYTVSLQGDEFCHYWLADGGEIIAMKDDGRYHVLSYFEAENMLYKASMARANVNAQRAQKQHGFLKSLTGNKRGLVILVNFKDNAFSTSNPNLLYNDVFNSLNYTDYGMTGSVRDYFLAQSYGMFDLTLDVAGPYTLPNPMSSYGGNDSNGSDIGVLPFARQSFLLADKDVDYKDYDWDGDGVVEQVFIVYAGYAEAQGASANTIWPHSWTLSQPLDLDGVSVSRYACSSELRGRSGNEIDGIGTICHEFSHCLGLMDHYDTSGSNFGTATWDLMASGSYNNNSCTPAAYTSFERWCMGWLEPVELTSQKDITDMKPLVDSPEAYIMYNDANKDEFYLLENRQLKGFDSALYGHGLLVFHVDYDKLAWESNKVNVVSSRQRVTIIPADGKKETSVSSLKSDPFPGPLGVTALTDKTTPAAILYNTNLNGTRFMGKPIEDISEDADGYISFKALYPELAVPAPKATLLESGSFKLSWPAVPYAKSYELQLTEFSGKNSPEEAKIIEESFDGTYRATAGFADIGTKLSDYLDNRGFSGSALFQSPYELRFGTGTTKGTLKSPTFDTLSTARFTLVLKVKPYNEGTKVKGVLNITTEKSSAMNVPFEFTEEGYLLLYPTDNIETLFFFNIKPESRMYLSYLALYDGEFTAEELGLEASARAPMHNVSTYTTTEPQYIFNELNPNSRYEVIVRAIDGNRYSSWCDVCNVTFTTGISEVQAEKPMSSIYYDLQGRRVRYPIHGNVYINNGKKIVY